MNALSKLLSEDHKIANANTGIYMYRLGHIVEALMQAGQFAMDPETRSVYFKTTKQFFEYHGDLLTPAEITRLVPPLIDAWKSVW